MKNFEQWVIKNKKFLEKENIFLSKNQIEMCKKVLSAVNTYNEFFNRFGTVIGTSEIITALSYYYQERENV